MPGGDRRAHQDLPHPGRARGVGVMPARDHQDVCRGLGVDIPEGDDLVVGVDDRRRDLSIGDLAEEAGSAYRVILHVFSALPWVVVAYRGLGWRRVNGLHSAYHQLYGTRSGHAHALGCLVAPRGPAMARPGTDDGAR